MKGYRVKVFIFALMLMTAGGELYSQPIIQWVVNLNGLLDSVDVANDITIDDAGNTYVTGRSCNLLGLLTGIMTVSYDTDGNERWRKDYDGLLNDEGKAIILDNTQQFVYVAGYTNGVLNLTAADFVLIKYNASNGDIIWVRTYNYGILGDDRATDITIDRQNNPVITGYSQGFLILLSPYDYATVKYDTAGTLLWVARYNGPGDNDDRSTSIASDSLSNIIVTGYSISNGSFHDYRTVKYSPTGVQQWAVPYNGPGNNEDRAYAIVVDNSNNIFVTGESMGSGTNYDYATVKYNPAGTQQWAGRYNGTGNNEDRAYAIVVDNFGDPVVTGSSRSGSTAGTEDYGTVKYNTTNGSQMWASTYNGTGNNEDRAYAIVVDNSNNTFVTGSSRSTGAAGSEDFATLEYNTGGTQMWVTRYNGGNEDRAYAIVVDNSNNFYVTGVSMTSSLNGSEDYLTIKYADDEVVVLHGETEIPSEFRVYQNYPNPFNPVTTIRLDISENAKVKFAVYDVLGNEKELLINGNMRPGSYNVSWDAGSYTSGIYFYKVTMNDRTVTGKMMLIK